MLVRGPEAKVLGPAAAAAAVVVLQFAGYECAALAPPTSAETRAVILVVFVFEDAEADDGFDFAVEVEEGGEDGDEDEDGEVVGEAAAERGEVDEAAEELVKGRLGVDGAARHHGDEVIAQGHGELGYLQAVPAGALGVRLPAD